MRLAENLLKICNKYMTFIITNKDGSRTQYSNHYYEGNEMEVDAAWDDVYAKFPEADYIEQF